VVQHGLSPAARAFDSIAVTFDQRFGAWESVAAQRRAVRAELARSFAPGSRVLEIGGGTGADASWLGAMGCEIVLTDISPAMVSQANARFAGRPALSGVVAGAQDLSAVEGSFDGAFSNFAAHNCVDALEPVAQGIARLVRPGGVVILVLFGTCCPGEWMVEALRRRLSAMFRRASRRPVPARLGGMDFTVRYFRAAQLRSAMAPWFDYGGARGIGVFVPPSAAEPWISRHPRLLSAFEALDRRFSAPLASLGDHVLHRFVRRADG
jgi:ubiquinone/menaquinone biosynthesis C-methylase UbiE